MHPETRREGDANRCARDRARIMHTRVSPALADARRDAAPVRRFRRGATAINPPAVAEPYGNPEMNTNTPETVNPAPAAEKPAAAPRAVSPLTACKRAENKGNRDTATRVRILTAAGQVLSTAAGARKGTDGNANRLADTLNREETRACFTAEERAFLLEECELLRKGNAPRRAAREMLRNVTARAAKSGETSRREKETARENAADARAAENAAKSARKSRKAEILAASATRPLTAEERAFLSAPARKRAAAAA